MIFHFFKQTGVDAGKNEKLRHSDCGFRKDNEEEVWVLRFKVWERLSAAMVVPRNCNQNVVRFPDINRHETSKKLKYYGITKK